MDDEAKLRKEIEERLERLKDIRVKRVLRKPRNQVTVEKVAKMVSFRFAVENYLLAHTMSKLELAKKLGVSHNQVYRWTGREQRRPGRLVREKMKEMGIIDSIDQV